MEIIVLQWAVHLFEWVLAVVFFGIAQCEKCMAHIKSTRTSDMCALSKFFVLSSLIMEYQLARSHILLYNIIRQKFYKPAKRLDSHVDIDNKKTLQSH